MKSPISPRELPKQLLRIPTLKVGFAIIRTWVAILLLIAAAGHFETWRAWFLCAAAIGVFQYHLNILGHDGLHYCVSSHRRLNELVTRWLLIAPQGMPMAAMRRNHLYHHHHLGEPGDKDAQYYDLADKSSPLKLVLWLIGAFSGIMAARIAWKLLFSRGGAQSEGPASSAQDLLSIAIVQGLMAAYATWMTGSPFGAAVLWFVPLGTMFTGLNSVRSLLEHAQLAGELDPDRLMTFRSNLLERFFLSPFNMNFHAEHHWFMYVPYGNLPELRRLAMARESRFLPVSSYFFRLRKLLVELPSA